MFCTILHIFKAILKHAIFESTDLQPVVREHEAPPSVVFYQLTLLAL